jgi:class 3 adenylate cyclase
VLAALICAANCVAYCAAIGATAKADSLVAGIATYAIGDAPILLIGPWESYAGNISDEEIRSSSRAPGFTIATLRSSLLRASPSADGPVAYRARIKMTPGSGTGTTGVRMALFFPGLEDFEALYVDGVPLYERKRGDSSIAPLVFESRGEEIEILLRSGPGDRRLDSPSLFPAFCLFGEETPVVKTQLALVCAAILVPSYSMLTAFLLFMLFLVWRKNREFLAFSLYVASLTLFYAAKHVLLLGFLDPSWSADFRDIAYIAARSIQYVALANFLATMYRDVIPRWLGATARVLPALPVAAVFAFPSALAEAYGAAIAYDLFFGLAALSFVAARFFSKDRRSRWLFPALLLAAGSIAAGMVLPDSVAGAYIVEPAGMSAFVLICTLMIVKKAGDAFESAEILSDYVDSVARTMKSFIPREFLDHLEKSDVADLRLGDHAKKEMTIFFSDIRGFTELSESLTVEENFAFINSYLSRVVPIIKENGGFVDKYIGDAIMALFPGLDGPDRAIRSAIAMQTKIVEYNGHRAKMGYRPISMGVGVHTGDLMLGVVGVSDRMESTVISDSVNLASRLQAITKAFNIALAISEQSFKGLDDPGSYKYRFIGKVKVKGKAAPISIFEIFDGIAPELFERKMKANMFFEQGMLSYYQKDFAGAMYYFKRVLDVMPEDGAASFYLDNCMKRASA